MRVLCAIRKQEGSPLKKLLVLLVLILAWHGSVGAGSYWIGAMVA